MAKALAEWPEGKEKLLLPSGRCRPTVNFNGLTKALAKTNPRNTSEATVCNSFCPPTLAKPQTLNTDARL
jgi:hypothetical protein